MRQMLQAALGGGGHRVRGGLYENNDAARWYREADDAPEGVVKDPFDTLPGGPSRFLRIPESREYFGVPATQSWRKRSALVAV